MYAYELAGKRVLVTGGTGTLGTPLVRKLRERGAKVTVVALDGLERAEATLGTAECYRQGDLRDFNTCLQVAEGQACVFHLMGVKGSTQIGSARMASAFVSFILCNTFMMEASFRQRVERFLFVGSINEYPPLPVRREDDVWNGAPVQNDRYNGIAKRAGEAQAETYLQEHGWDAVRIVRPANVYGPFDDFDPASAHVIPSLIHRTLAGENPLVVAGDGSAIRDFIFTEDVVDGMILAVEKAPACMPINLGSGRECSIRELVETLVRLVPDPPDVKWDAAKPAGDPKRVLDVTRAKDVLGFEAKTSLEEGLRQTIDWYRQNRNIADRRGRELYG